MNPNSLNQILDRFAGQDPLKRFYIRWGAVFAVILVINYFVLMPIWSKTAEAKKGVQTLAAQSTRLKTLHITAGNRASRLAELEQDLKNEVGSYVKSYELPTVISSISKMAGQWGVELRKTNILKRESITQGEAGSRLPLQFAVSGSYERVGDFLGQVEEDVDFFFAWESIRIQAVKELDGNLDADLRMGFYERGKH